MIRKITLVLLTFILPGISCKAWVYPEHREIMLVAIRKLDSTHRVLLDRLWTMARTGHDSRLHGSVADFSQDRNPKFIDYAAFPAISGDHSVSAENLLNNVLNSDWILNVADVAARLKNELDASENESGRAAALRDSDLRFLRADPEYVSRAGANNVHFMLARSGVNTTARDYFDSCRREGTEVNLISTYLWYHLSAIEKAHRLSEEQLTPEKKSALALAALADEAFAIHFLEDAFSSGHVAGIWGNAALRKGTHDYYDERGLEVTTWQGERLVLTGDAYMRPVDANRAAITVLLSLNQFLAAFTVKDMPIQFNDRPGVFEPDTLNIGQALVNPGRVVDPGFRDMYEGILMTLPVPGLATGLGEIPRFRAEIGPFIGLAPAARVSFLASGFSESEKTGGMVPGLEFAIHTGLGLDGVLNESGDGLVFLDLGWRLDGASSMKLENDPSYKQFGSILSAIPTRDALYMRLRLPYYVIPGDLIILGPLLYIVAPKTMNKVVATAGAGGLIPWQSGLVSPIGRFQFILGREVGICFYGSLNGRDSYLSSFTDSNGNKGLILYSMKTTHFDFPFLEYRPVRTFSRRQSASLLVQLYAGLDIPGKPTMIEPVGMTPPALNNIWSLGVRFAFDWRYYYAKKKK